MYTAALAICGRPGRQSPPSANAASGRLSNRWQQIGYAAIAEGDGGVSSDCFAEPSGSDATFTSLSRQHGQVAWHVVEGGRRTSDGTTGVIGARLYQGQCVETPPLTHDSSDNIRLTNGCSKALVVKYGGTKTAGVKTVRAGQAQLVDLDAGRSFFEIMKGLASAHAKAGARPDAKL